MSNENESNEPINLSSGVIAGATVTSSVPTEVQWARAQEFELEAEAPSDLNPEQRARVEALHHARTLLERRRATPMTSNTTVEPPSVGDLFRLAEFIVSGRRT